MIKNLYSKHYTIHLIKSFQQEIETIRRDFVSVATGGGLSPIDIGGACRRTGEIVPRR